MIVGLWQLQSGSKVSGRAAPLPWRAMASLTKAPDLKSNLLRSAIHLALWTAAIRVVAGVLLILLARSAPESGMMVIADLPTLFLYWFLQHFGFDSSITNERETRFFVIAVAWWLVLGAFIGFCRGAMRGKHSH